MRMAISNPTQLVDEFKKSGEFDRLRRELLSDFQNGDGISTFTSKVQDIARQKLVNDAKLQFMPQESVHRELMQEMERYPLVERAVADVRVVLDPSFTSGIRSSIQKILHEDRRKSSCPEKDDLDNDSTNTPAITNARTPTKPD